MSGEKKSGINLLPFKIYGVIYLVLMVCYIVGSIWSGTVISTGDWEKSAFPKGGKTTEQLLNNVNEDIASFRADMDYSFETTNKVAVQINAGDKVTLPVAAEIALAIQEDKAKSVTDPKMMVFPYTEMAIYKLGWFWNINWAYTFTVYNLLGMFMGLYLGLKAPVNKMLSESASETAQALADAKAAQKEASELKLKYETLINEVELERARLTESLHEEEEAERIRQKELAEMEAKAILKSVKSSINADIEIAATKLKHEIAEHAVVEARKILAEKVNESTHKEAVDDFISQLDSMKS